MRIRSIRPEFWSSEDIAAMDWHTRLVYIGLWSYVDDNGVGRDIERLIVTDLFPLDDDLRESSRRVTGALQHLSSRGHVTRYEVDGKRYLHIVKWATHQRIEKASKGRYPLPTCENAEITEPSPTTTGVLPDMSGPGEGEKGRRGEGEKNSSASAGAEREFDEWYDLYPRKKGKADALKAYKAARKKADAETILAGLRRLLPELTSVEENYRPYPAKWLRAESWEDQPSATVTQLRDDQGHPVLPPLPSRSPWGQS